MPGQEPKGQHTVQRAYLAGFQDPDYENTQEPALWVYMPGKSPFRQRPERVAKRNYYYCYQRNGQRQFMVEHVLQKLEDAALPVLQKLRERKFTLSPEDRLTFAGYIALSHTRVPTFERLTDRLTSLFIAKQVEFITKNEVALRTAIAEIEEETGEKLDPEKFYRDLTSGTVVAKQTNREWSLRKMFEVMIFLQRLVYDMSWTFLLAPDNDPGFLTSDNPVAIFGPPNGPAVETGPRVASSPLLSFPISRNVCVIAHRGAGPKVTMLSGFGVRNVNKEIISCADTQLYAPFGVLSVQKILNGVVSQRKASGRVILRKGRVVEE